MSEEIVIYKDNYFVLTKFGNVDSVIASYNIDEFDFEINVGDVIYNSKDKQEYKKSEINESFKTIDRLCVVRACDENFIYVIKNGDKKITRIFNHQNLQLLPFQLIYLSEDCQEIGFEKGYIKNIFDRFLSNKNLENFKKNIFKIRRYCIESYFSHIVVLRDIDDISQYLYIPDFELYDFYGNGDIYLLVEFGKEREFLFEPFLSKNLSSKYLELFRSEIEGHLEEEKLKNRYEYTKKIREKCQKYYKKFKNAFSKEKKYSINDVIASYSVEEFEENNKGEQIARLVCYDEERALTEKFVACKHLPPFIQEGWTVDLVLEGAFKEEKYYLTHRFDDDLNENEFLNLERYVRENDAEHI